MASLISGYEYDIFISYRQKDNKGERWVSEFVDALKTELESTFKEEISVYFDINPHDGLLETHDVNASLKEKLKCLVFIPVISQTYCDSKCFAWLNEFCAFNKLAKEDRFGRDIRLAGGNVTSRILPVRIHDLESEDRILLENELGGFIRGIEFIYKEPGVNRPLKREDDEKKNLNNTKYHNQINKVANSVKEIITAIKKHNQGYSAVPVETSNRKIHEPKNLKSKIIITFALALALIIFGYFFFPGLFKPVETVEKSIAVLPFKSLSVDPEKQYLADGMMDAILLHLQKFKDLRVMSRTSVEQYRGTTKTTRKIGQELDVEYLLEGSFQKYGDNVKLIVQLIRAREEGNAWANEYNRNWKDIFIVQSEVAQSIAKELYTVITPAEKQLLEKIPTPDLTAYDLYLRANDFQKEYVKTRDVSFYQKAATFYKASLEIDPSFARAYSGLAMVYFDRYRVENYFKENFLDSCLVLVNIALSFDDKLDEAYYIKGNYYWQYGELNKSLDCYDKALELNPNFYLAYYKKGYLLEYGIQDFVKAIDNYQRALKICRGDERPSLIRELGFTFLDIGFVDKAKYYYQEAFALDGNKVENYDCLSAVEFDLTNFDEASQFAKKANEIDTAHLESMLNISLMAKHNEDAYIYSKKLIDYYGKKDVLNLGNSHSFGYVFYQQGKYKEADKYFRQQIKYSEESIKLRHEILERNLASACLAQTYAFLGDKLKAYYYLDELKKMKVHTLWMLTFMKHWPMYDTIRKEERFQKILQIMEDKYQREHLRVQKWLEEEKML